MKKRLLFAALCTLLYVESGHGQAAPASVQTPGLHFAHTSCELGEIPLGHQRDTAFVFRTAADVAVVFSAVTNCSCTTVEYPRRPLKRDERSEIRVRYDAREGGYFRKTVTVKYLADGERRTAVLTISGAVGESER